MAVWCFGALNPGSSTKPAGSKPPSRKLNTLEKLEQTWEHLGLNPDGHGPAMLRLLRPAMRSAGSGLRAFAAPEASGDQLVGFGKHAALSYQQLFETQPGWCSWFVKSYTEKLEKAEKQSPAGRALGEYLQGKGVTPSPSSPTRFSPSSAKGQGPSAKGQYGQYDRSDQGQHGKLVDGQWVLSFGKHKGKTFAEVMSQDPDYCEYCVNLALEGTKASNSLLAFSIYVMSEAKRLE